MTIRELQREIGEWHVQQFGPTNDGVKANAEEKLEEEVHELLFALLDASAESDDLIKEELSDTLIAMLGLAFRMDIDLDAAVRRKFDIVRNRDQRARDAERGIEWGAQ